MVIVKKLNFLGLIKRIDLRLIGRGNSVLDKFKIISSFFILAPLRKLGITKKEILITMKSDEGLLICGDKSIRAAKSDYEGFLRKYFDLKKGNFIDIGANLGKYTIMMAKRLGENGKVIGIEPEEHTIELLKKNVKINNLKNTFIVGKACSDKNGKETLYLENTLYSGGLHSLKKYEHHVGKKIIDVEKLDSIVSRLGIKKIDLIKIDVEGAELKVLKGAQKILKDSHPKIICECLDEKSEKELRNFFNKFSYNVERINEEDILATHTK